MIITSRVQPGWRWFIEYSTPYDAHMRLIRSIIAEKKSKYQYIEIVDFFDIGKTLVIDGKIQSSISDEHIYHEALVHPSLLLHPNPTNVLVVGGGEGATLREVLKHKTVKKVVMVDIDEEVINFAKRYLNEWHQGAFDDSRVRIVIADGRRFIENANEKFDVVILDVVDPLEEGPGYRLYTKEFYELVKKVLNVPGVMVTQATSPVNTSNVFSILHNTIKSVFKHVYPYMVYIKSFDGPWGFIMASDELRLEEVDVGARISERISGELKFYDEETHRHMFSLPRNVREELQRETRIATDKSPVFMPA